MARKKKKQILSNITVEEYAAGGKSLARVDGKVIFIENTVPGDVVDVLITRNKKGWAEAKPLIFNAFAPDRLEPFCDHFGICGGCQWQMLPYEKQLVFKQKQVVDNLSRIGKLALPQISLIIGATGQTTHYRNKIEYTFSNKRYLEKEQLANPEISNKENVAGFHAKGMFDKIVDIKTCYLQQDIGNQIRIALKDYAIEQGFSFYDFYVHSGFMRTMQIRLCTTGHLMVNVVFGNIDTPAIDGAMNFLANKFPEITTLLYTINGKWNDSLHELEPVVFKGPGYAIEQLEEFKFKIGPKSFFQTNTKQAEKLYQVTRDFAELTGEEIVYDLYCGTGSIGIFLSKKAKKIVGVEMVAEAIEDAKENATLNNIATAAFFAGDVIDVCNDDFFAAHGHPDVIITDPPRAGMHKLLVEKILEIAAPMVVYVSCNPATQARDLNLLQEKYHITKVQPVDLFPHTLHIENVVQLRLNTV